MSATARILTGLASGALLGLLLAWLDPALGIRVADIVQPFGKLWLNALRAHADIALLVSAHDDRAHVEPLLYHSALQHLLDGLFVMLCEADPERHASLQANLERIQPLLEH